ncbi:MAG: aldo/keto reductase [Cyanobacteria bacterium P01_H01_bin.130]
MPASPKRTRRNFLATSLTTGLGIIGCSSYGRSQDSAGPSATVTSTSPSTAEAAATSAIALPKRTLGRTKIELPVLGLGGAGQTPLSSSGQEKAAIEQIQRAWELGIRYFDTAASYGPSEEFLGKVLPDYRQEVFIATKTAVQTRDGAWRQLERSLKRLNTDYLDLWQFHHISFEEELDALFGPDGAAKALEEAQDQGIVKFSGITGHHEPAVIAEGLRRYPFDHTLIPINAAEIHHPRSFIPGVLPVAQEKNIGVTAMKVPAYGRLFRSGGLDGMPQALGYTLSQPGVHCAVIAAEDIPQLEENIRAAAAFQPLDAETLATLEQRTAQAWEANAFYRRWT